MPLAPYFQVVLLNFLKKVNQGEVANYKQNEIHFSYFLSTMSILRNSTAFKQKCLYQQKFCILFSYADVK